MKRVIAWVMVLLFAASAAFAQSAADFVNSGNAKYRRGDLDGALADFTKAIDLKSNDADAYYSRALAKRPKGDHEGALADFRKAGELGRK